MFFLVNSLERGQRKQEILGILLQHYGFDDEGIPPSSERLFDGGPHLVSVRSFILLFTFHLVSSPLAVTRVGAQSIPSVSYVSAVLKLLSMDVVYPAVLHMRKHIHPRIPFVDVRGTWHVHVRLESAQNVRVINVSKMSLF